MDARNRPSSPALSPFQHALKHSPLAQSPTYPSPARTDPDTTSYPPPEGLGLYNYSMPIPGSAPQTSAMYPPSPHSTESWSNLPNGASPLLGDSQGDTWQSLYEPRVSRSPLPWNGHYSIPPSALVGGRRTPVHSQSHAISHRSSLSSGAMPLYSRDDPEPTFTPQVKVEAMDIGSEWPLDTDSGPHALRHQPLTVSPERLSTAGFPYSYSYSPPVMSKYESSPEVNRMFEARTIERPSSSLRHRSPGSKQTLSGPVQRTRIRRTPTTEENANYSCNICGKLFQRSYNHKTHMDTHDPARQYPNHCQYEGCGRKFVRRTDLQRHEQSVHVKARNWRCSRCDQSFARKDTLRRHEEDGCSKRNQVRDPELALRRSSARAAAGHMPFRHSARSTSQSEPSPLF